MRTPRHSSAAVRQEIRASISEQLAACVDELARTACVARALETLRITLPVLTHYTFDEPLSGPNGMEVMFTYHLADGSAMTDPRYREEVRGAGIAFIGADGLRLDGVDAEVYRLFDEIGPPPED